jgi:hypothetical protein
MIDADCGLQTVASRFQAVYFTANSQRILTTT